MASFPNQQSEINNPQFPIPNHQYIGYVVGGGLKENLRVRLTVPPQDVQEHAVEPAVPAVVGGNRMRMAAVLEGPDDSCGVALNPLNGEAGRRLQHAATHADRDHATGVDVDGWLGEREAACLGSRYGP